MGVGRMPVVRKRKVIRAIWSKVNRRNPTKSIWPITCRVVAAIGGKVFEGIG